MNEEMEQSFRNVETTLEEELTDERLRFVALMVNDMARNVARMAGAGAISAEVLDLTMNHTQAVMAVVIAANNLTLEQLAELREQQPDPMVEILGFGPERGN